MGLRVRADLETSLGPSKNVYVRVENINLNRTFGKIKVAVTYWIDKESSEDFKHSEERYPENQISNHIVHYRSKNDLGQELYLPVVFEFDMHRPVKIMVPIFEEREYTAEVPYVSFDAMGRRQTKYKTQKFTESVKKGEREDTQQVLDLDIEHNLVSWCYGQVKAELSKSLPVELIEDY